jgi:tetratricopeptide (TPR) repeat protein
VAVAQGSRLALWAVMISAGALVAGAATYRRMKRSRRVTVAVSAPARASEPPSPSTVTLPPRPRESPPERAATVPDAAPERPASPPGAAIVEEAPALPAPRLPVSAAWYEGAEGHRLALDEQARTRAPMLVYLRVDWCPYCRRMDREVLPAPAVTRFLEGVVKVRINPETSPTDRALTESYGVSRYPSLFVIAAPGGKPHSVPHFSRAGSEDIDVTAEKFVKACEEVGLGASRQLVSEGAAKSRAGDLAGARADLDRAIELDPGNAEAFFWRGYGEARGGERGKAVGDLKHASELDPKEPYAYAELAGLYQRAGQLDDAIATATRLIDVAPDWHEGAAFAMRGYAQGQKGDREHALADFAEACRRGNTRACGAGQPHH